MKFEKCDGGCGKESPEEMNRIIWLTGHSGSGKTTIARLLAKEIGAIILDGDEMRASISRDLSYSREDRTKQNLRIAALADALCFQIPIIVAVISPIRKVREAINDVYHPIWIYCKRELPEREGHFYEESFEYFTLDIDDRSPEDHVLHILEYLKEP